MNVNAAIPVTAGPDTAVAKLEQNLFEHVADSMKQRGSAVPNGRVANPGNLISEALGNLDGYLARVRHLGAVNAAAVNSRRDLKNSEGRELPNATGSGKSIEEVAQGKERVRVDDSSLDRTTERLLETVRQTMQYGMQTYLVVAGTGRIPKTVNTLLRGQ